jgi:hypothetical protein
MLDVFIYKYALRPFSLIALFLLLTPLVQAAEKEPIAFGRVTIGESRLPLNTKDFKVNLDLKEKIQAKVILKKKSIEWIRIEEVLLTPRGRVALYFKGNAQDFNIQYRGQSILMQQQKKYAHTEFYVSLFQHDPIKIFKQGKYVGKITFSAKKQKKNEKAHLIDYSCSRNNIKITGLDGEFISLGCRTHRIGAFGSEKPMMEILWTSANFRLLDGSEPPYIAVFLDNHPTKLKVKNHLGQIREIQISARIPKRLHRLNTAYGFGPYAFHTSFTEDLNNPEDKLEYKVDMAPAIMLYFNLKLSAMNSIRGFDAAVWQKSVFNNAGVYFASDIANILDNKLTITTLLGMQHLYFQFDDDYEAISEPIFPQGIEFLYKHAFGITNYIVSGGAFLSPSETVDYQNIWIRWGKNYFWELNYIYWGKDQFNAAMYGLSIGLPLKGFF